MSLSWLDACDTLLSLLGDCNFSLAFSMCKSFKSHAWKENRKKNTLMIYLVSYLKLKKNTCAHFKSPHLLWVNMNEFSCTDKGGGCVNYMFQPSRFQRLIDSASQTRPGRGQSPLFTDEEPQLDLG